MTGTVLAPGTPTPPDTLVFVPLDGRHAPLPPARLIAPVAYAWHSGSGPRRAGWILVPCLTRLRSEFNALAPGRDKASDGSIGDTSHAASSSDHNPDESGATPYEDSDSIDEVHAIDVDKDLRKSGWTMQRAVDIIVARHRSGADDRLQYVIWNRQIASRSWGWTWRAYTGSNPHDKHAHFSARYTTAQEADTSPWGLLADTVPPAAPQEDEMTESEFLAMMDKWAQRASAGRAALITATAAGVLGYDPGRGADGKIAPGAVPNPDTAAPENPTLAPASALRDAVVTKTLAYDLRTRIAAISDAVAAIAKNVAADDADLPQILAAIEQAKAEIPDSVLDALAGEARPVEEIADALRSALGDRARAVGALLAGE